MNKITFGIAATAFLAVTLLSACEKTEFSPYQVRLSKEQRDRNSKNINRILAQNISPTDTLRFALTSDTQGFYDETTDLVKSVNKQRNIAFLLHGGDITDFGIEKEFKWMDDIFAGLNIPYVTVIGNHDCLANGKKIYKELYGDFDHSFQVAGNKFVFLNTNFLEFDSNIPRLDWLQNELKDTTSFRNAFVISHVAPDDVDFNPAKEQDYAKIVRNGKVRMSIHGHRHNFEFRQFYNDGLNYLVIGSSRKRYYEIITVVGTKVTMEIINF